MKNIENSIQYAEYTRDLDLGARQMGAMGYGDRSSSCLAKIVETRTVTELKDKAMTIKELITELQKYPPDMMVCHEVSDDCGDYLAEISHVGKESHKSFDDSDVVSIG